jgi:hypothetical protein
MPDDRNRTSVLRQLAALQKMKLPELQDKWRDLYGSEPPSLSKLFIQKRLAYRIQELFYGGLSQDTKNMLKRYAAADVKSPLPAAQKNNGRILPGTRFIREWHGETHEVIARDKGFEYAGQMYRSLSAIATKITGTKWNGVVFFRGQHKRSAVK